MCPYVCGPEHRPSEPLLPLCCIGAPRGRHGELRRRVDVQVGACARGADGRSLAMIQLTGELDSFVADQIGEPLRQFVDFAKGVVIDMAGVDFVDSQGLRLVEHLGELARASGGSLHLHDPSPVVTRLVGLLDGGARVDICHSAQAIAS